MKQFKLTLILTMLMSMVGLQAFAAFDTSTKVEVKGLYYYLDNEHNQAQVTSMPSGKYSGDIIIPSSISYSNESYSVTYIGYGAFDGCSGLTSVIIPNSVTYIFQHAFRSCSGLTSITIPNSVTSIGQAAFYWCSGLSSITIPNSVMSIGRFAFEGCSGLTAFTVEKGNNWYDSRDNCNAIIETATNKLIIGCNNSIIPNSVTSIGDYAFTSCSGLTSITIPNSVKTIGDYAFNYCKGLTSITIPNSVTSIGKEAFYWCTGLASITFPNNETSIWSRAFEGTKWFNDQPDGLVYAGLNAYTYKGIMPKNTALLIMDGTKSICNEAFRDQSSLTSVTIPSSVTSIGDGAFYGCSGLTSITIPDNVSNIGNNAFYGTKWYDNQPDGLVYAGLNAYKYKGTMSEKTAITMKDGTKSICQSAFYGCDKLTSIAIPNSVTSIDDNAFQECTRLTSITIPNSVTNIGISIFSGCKGTNYIMVESGNTKYDSRDNCNAIIESSTNTLIAGCPNSFIPNSVTSIGERAFLSCHYLTSITIPECVTSIGDYAFVGCKGLTSITIPNSVTSIGKNAFSSCKGLTSITIPNSVTSIGKEAFSNCEKIENVYCYAMACPSIEPDAFYTTPIGNATLHVPAASVNNYKAHALWGEFKDVVPLTEEEMGIERPTMMNGTDSTSVIYNLNGQRISTPAKGLNIIHGRKVVIR